MSESLDESNPSPGSEPASEPASEPVEETQATEPVLSSPARGWESLRKAALEAGFVVLGVVLAFAINEWRKAQVAQERSREALEAVASEVEANRAALASSVSYHAQKMMGLREMREAGEPASPRFFDRGFVHPAQVLSNAWEAATATDAIRGWEYETLITVSRLYANQEQYQAQSQGVSEVIYHYLLEEGTEGVAARGHQIGSIISSFWWRECQLLAEYATVLPALGREAPPVPPVCPEGGGS